jgi:hypothetical protein
MIMYDFFSVRDSGFEMVSGLLKKAGMAFGIAGNMLS